jgi:hypothetical protein
MPVRADAHLRANYNSFRSIKVDLMKRSFWFYGALITAMMVSVLAFAMTKEDCCRECDGEDCIISQVNVQIKPPAGTQVQKWCSSAIKISIASADGSVTFVDNATATINQWGNGQVNTARSFDTKNASDGADLKNVLQNPVVRITGLAYGCSAECSNPEFNGVKCYFSNNPEMWTLSKNGDCAINLSIKAVGGPNCDIYLPCCN